MTPPHSRSLVVDASVLRSSGKTDHPMSRSSREALNAILRICHHVVITADIRKEWDRHQSLFAAIWRASMESKKKIDSLDAIDSRELLKAMAASSMDPTEYRLVEKDAHIISAALCSDRILVTLDDRLKRTLTKYSLLAAISSRIKWVNPVSDGSAIFASEM